MEDNTVLLSKATSLVRSVNEGIHNLMDEWRSYHKETLLLGLDPAQHLIIERNDMDQLVSEIMMMKEFLPSILNKEYINTIPKLIKTEQNLSSLSQERAQLVQEKDLMSRKLQSLMADYECEKKEKFDIKCSLTDINHQFKQQSEYCTSLGSVCGMLLWRTSQNEDCIHNLLSGSRISEFLQLVNTTIQSYVSTYGNELPDESSEEAQFVLSLCGTVTNIAASAYGRDYLSSCSEGQMLLDAMCGVLANAPVSSQCTKLKSLILMLLYNISINQNGLTLLRNQPNILRILVWLAKEENSITNKIYSLQLLQSLILEPHTPTLVHQILEAIPIELLQEFSMSTHTQLSQVACELMSDMKSYK